MADLSTLDDTQPPDTQQVAQGAARIRETRNATKTSFGIEHFLTGEHKIPVGTTAARPAAGHAGRLYINIDLIKLQYDAGGAWITIGGVGGAGNPRQPVTVGALPSLSNIVSETTVATLPALTTFG